MRAIEDSEMTNPEPELLSPKPSNITFLHALLGHSRIREIKQTWCFHTPEFLRAGARKSETWLEGLGWDVRTPLELQRP